jgi:hypothetical protein
MDKEFFEITNHAKADEAKQGRVKIDGLGESVWCETHSRWYFSEYGCILCDMEPKLPNFPDDGELTTRASRILDGYNRNPMRMPLVIAYLEKGMLEQKREIDQLKAENEQLRSDNRRMAISNETFDVALHRILSWSESYPVDVFPEINLERLRDYLESEGISFDRVSAAVLRRVVGPIGDLARAALQQRGI